MQAFDRFATIKKEVQDRKAKESKKAEDKIEKMKEQQKREEQKKVEKAEQIKIAAASLERKMKRNMEEFELSEEDLAVEKRKMELIKSKDYLGLCFALQKQVAKLRREVHKVSEYLDVRDVLYDRLERDEKALEKELEKKNEDFKKMSELLQNNNHLLENYAKMMIGSNIMIASSMEIIEDQRKTIQQLDKELMIANGVEEVGGEVLIPEKMYSE
jgi:hypothetical protein